MNANPTFPVDTDMPTQHSALSQWLKKRRWFLIFVRFCPTLLAMLYYGLIASDIYVSESRFVIKSPDQKTRPDVDACQFGTDYRPVGRAGAD
ncbi:hypothetical protein [Sphingobium sp. Ant17]|uniref:hypothetical protein n=1 Tax=Sphingobium sp. Ant17 TaxID=1461752 RepID=UPI000452B508|nr:hypothetical protein [Sphingobium sp. Ant17]EXS67930.1 hypothetical protein BF95_01140 [Sphingobium sp. Ant17]